MGLDRYDTHILQLLQRDGRLSNRDLSDTVGLSAAPCWRRVKRLEEEGYIEQYIAQVSRKKVKLQILAFAQISLDNHHSKTLKTFNELLEKTPEILECHSVSGECDYLLKVVASDMEAYDQFLTSRLLQMNGIRSINTLFSMQQPKLTHELPVE
jgi:Lrp/AsnC family leucine-responsive transcriptional regulator